MPGRRLHPFGCAEGRGGVAMTKAMRTFTNDVGLMGRLARTLVARSIREQFAHALIVTAERPEA